MMLHADMITWYTVDTSVDTRWVSGPDCPPDTGHCATACTLHNRGYKVVMDPALII